jgi:hypothetical protein
LKTFFAVLFAILIAAIIIGFCIFSWRGIEARTRYSAYMKQLQLDNAISEEKSLWTERMAEPRFDPNGQKLADRLRELQEASDAGKPFPPSPFLKSETPPAVATPVGDMRIRLSKSVRVDTPRGEIILNAGQKVKIVRQDDAFAWIECVECSKNPTRIPLAAINP